MYFLYIVHSSVQIICFPSPLILTGRSITYEVNTPPNLGRLMMETETANNFKIVHSFTQADVNASKVFYEHTHPFSGLYANDFFVFNIHAHLATTIFNKVSLNVYLIDTHRVFYTYTFTENVGGYLCVQWWIRFLYYCAENRSD